MLVLDDIWRRRGGLDVLRGLRLSVSAGELFCLVGPSGCGKTTLLRLIAGLDVPDAGTVEFEGRPVHSLPPQERAVVLVFQHAALFPQRTVAGNVEYGLEVRGVPPGDRRHRVAAMLDRLGLHGLGDSVPYQLSGGQQQRVALARALVLRPRLLLLDEPLSHLDPESRAVLRDELRRVRQELGLTLMHVTHDPLEALSLGDRVGVLLGGVLAQVAAPRQIHSQPVSRSVAEFFGAVNWVPGRIVTSNASGVVVGTPIGDFQVSSASGALPGTSGWLGIRPQAVRPAAQGPHRLFMVVRSQVFFGDWTELTLSGPDGVVLRGRLGGADIPPRPGASIEVGINAQDLFWVPGS